MENLKPQREWELEVACKELTSFLTAALQHFEDGTAPSPAAREMMAAKVLDAQKLSWVPSHLHIRLQKKST